MGSFPTKFGPDTFAVIEKWESAEALITSPSCPREAGIQSGRHRACGSGPPLSRGVTEEGTAGVSCLVPTASVASRNWDFKMELPLPSFELRKLPLTPTLSPHAGRGRLPAQPL